MPVTTSQITTSSNGNLSLDPNGSGKVRLNPLASSGNQPVGVDNNGNAKKFLVTDLNSSTPASDSGVMIQASGGATVQKSTISQLVSSSGADKVYTASNGIGYVSGSGDKQFEVQIPPLPDRGDGGPPPSPDPPVVGGDPEVPWGPVLTMVHQYFDDNPTAGGGGLISNNGIRGLGDNKFNNLLPSDDQYFYGLRSAGSTGVTATLDQGSINASDVDISTGPNHIISRSSGKVRMSQVVIGDTSTSTFSGGPLNAPWADRFITGWIFHGAQVLFNGRSSSIHTNHTVIEKTTAQTEQEFVIPCSNTASSSTAAYMFVIGSGSGNTFTYAPPPRYGGGAYLGSYAGPGNNSMNFIETDLGFSGDITVTVAGASAFQAICCYWTVSY